MSKIQLILFAAVVVAFVSGCSEESSEQQQHHQSQPPPAPDYRSGPHFFKDASKVDNPSYGPLMYRLENDEVICYVTGKGGEYCHWKQAETK